MTSQSIATSHSNATPVSRIVAPLFAAALGLLFIFGVGFVDIAAVHDAAHDTRHLLAFPCH